MAILFAWAVAQPVIGAEVIQFNPNLHPINGLATGSILQGPYTLSLAAGPVGSRITLVSFGGMGVDSSALIGPPGESLVNAGRLNIIAAGASAGQGEGMSFSFNRPGVLTGLMFDGVKDESFEYFRLETPSGDVLTIFDFEVPLRLSEDGLTDTVLTQATNPTYLTDNSDDRLDFHIPFPAGGVFKMTYGEHPYPQGYTSNNGELPNGARWQGLVVVPEPTTIWLAAAAGATIVQAAQAARVVRR